MADELRNSNLISQDISDVTINYPLNPYWIISAQNSFPAIAELYAPADLVNPKITDNYDGVWYFSEYVFLQDIYILIKDISASAKMYMKLDTTQTAVDYLQNRNNGLIKYDEYYSTDGGRTINPTTRYGDIAFTAIANYDFWEQVFTITMRAGQEQETYQVIAESIFDSKDYTPGVYATYDYLSLGRYCCPNNLGGVLKVGTSDLHIAGASNNWYFNDENTANSPLALSITDFERTDNNGFGLNNPNYFPISISGNIQRGGYETSYTKNNLSINDTWEAAVSSTALPAGEYVFSGKNFQSNVSMLQHSAELDYEFIKVVNAADDTIVYASISAAEAYRSTQEVSFTLNSSTRLKFKNYPHVYDDEGRLMNGYINSFDSVSVKNRYNKQYYNDSIAAQSWKQLSLTVDTYDGEKNKFDIVVNGQVSVNHYSILERGKILNNASTPSLNFTLEKLPYLVVTGMTATNVVVEWNSSAIKNNSGLNVYINIATTNSYQSSIDSYQVAFTAGGYQIPTQSISGTVYYVWMSANPVNNSRYFCSSEILEVIRPEHYMTLALLYHVATGSEEGENYNFTNTGIPSGASYFMDSISGVRGSAYYKLALKYNTDYINRSETLGSSMSVTFDGNAISSNTFTAGPPNRTVYDSTFDAGGNVGGPYYNTRDLYINNRNLTWSEKTITFTLSGTCKYTKYTALASTTTPFTKTISVTIHERTFDPTTFLAPSVEEVGGDVIVTNNNAYSVSLLIKQGRNTDPGNYEVYTNIASGASLAVTDVVSTGWYSFKFSVTVSGTTYYSSYTEYLI